MVSEATRKSMQGNKGKNTKPELLMRRELRAAGYTGYRIHWKKAPGKPDIAFPGRKIAIFVHGCFWHHHEGCHYATMPASNTEFWQAKFERNRQRDERVTAQLEAEGWKVIVIWECELKGDAMARTGEYLYSVLSV